MPKLVTVAAYNNPLEAHLAKGRLDVEGIPAYLAHEHHVWANWVYSQALGGVKVQVFVEDADAASKILDAHNKGDYEDSLGEVVSEIDDNTCPKCGSKEFQSRFPIGMILLVLLHIQILLLFGIKARNGHGIRLPMDMVVLMLVGPQSLILGCRYG